MAARVEAIIYPVSDPAATRALVELAVGCAPTMDESYYVGFDVDGLDVGLDPHGRAQGMTGPVVYWSVEDIRASIDRLVAAGATLAQDAKDVGGGKLVARVDDGDGNSIGLIQPA